MRLLRDLVASWFLRIRLVRGLHKRCRYCGYKKRTNKMVCARICILGAPTDQAPTWANIKPDTRF